MVAFMQNQLNIENTLASYVNDSKETFSPLMDAMSLEGSYNIK